MNIGQKSSFMCSHVDSLTPENGATKTDSSSQSYKKCNNVPPNDVIAKPISCHNPIDFFIEPPINVFIKSIFKVGDIYTKGKRCLILVDENRAGDGR